jgi:hypothetical protein
VEVKERLPSDYDFEIHEFTERDNSLTGLFHALPTSQLMLKLGVTGLILKPHIHFPTISLIKKLGHNVPRKTLDK